MFVGDLHLLRLDLGGQSNRAGHLPFARPYTGRFFGEIAWKGGLRGRRQALISPLESSPFLPRTTPAPTDIMRIYGYGEHSQKTYL